MNNRRKLVIALGACALASPLATPAQTKIWRVGFLAQRHVDFVDSDYYYGPFRQGMRELGYVEGKNLVIEWRSAEGKSEHLPELAAELVNSKVDVIVTAGSPATHASQKTDGYATEPYDYMRATFLSRQTRTSGLSKI
jgi:putative ABC transport system substrate-binding protein